MIRRRKSQPYVPKVCIPAGTTEFFLWMRHYRRSKQTMLAKYWEERGYAWVPKDTAPPEIPQSVDLTRRIVGERDQ